MTPQATLPPAFPVALLPSSASPVPLQVAGFDFGINCRKLREALSNTQIPKWSKEEAYTPRSSAPAWMTMARPAMSLHIRNQRIRSSGTPINSSAAMVEFQLIKTDLTPPSPRVRILSTWSMLVSPKIGVAMFPRSPAWLSFSSQERITLFWKSQLHYWRNKTLPTIPHLT